MKTICLAGRGDPSPQPRHQVSRTGRAYIPSEHRIHVWKNLIRAEACGHSDEPPSEDLCEVDLKFFMSIPKSRRKADGTPKARLAPTCRADIDNLAKAVLDCLQGDDCIMQDDRQVVKLTASKAWTKDEVGRVEIKVKFI